MGDFTPKFSYNNIIPTTTKLPEYVTPSQTADLPKPVTSNGTKVTPENQTVILNSVEMCWIMFLVVFEKEDLKTSLHEYYKKTNKQTKNVKAFLDVNWKRKMFCYWFASHHDIMT